MRRPSSALRELERTFAVLPSGTPITAGRLTELVGQAARECEDAEHDEYMGEDQ